MNNSIFNLFNNTRGFNNPMMNTFGNMQNFMNQFNTFRNSFQGDPKQQVQELLNSGQMSQSQFNQLSQMATQLHSMLNGK